MGVEARISPDAPGVRALGRQVQRFHRQLEQAAAGLPRGLGGRELRDRVLPLYDAALALRQAARAVVTELGRPDFFAGPVRQAERGAARVLDAAWHADRTVAQVTGVGRESHAEMTVSVRSGSTAGAARWHQARDGRNLPDMRISGSISPPAAHVVADRLAHVPARVVSLTDSLGTRGTLFSGRLTDVWGYRHLRGERPRGWPEGSSWDTVPGAGDAGAYAANPGREHTGRGHGATSLVLHEYGHSVDWAAARPGERRASAERAWRDGPWRELRRREDVSGYLRNHAEEWYAEAFARYTRSPQSQAALARWYPQTWAYLRDRLGEQRF